MQLNAEEPATDNDKNTEPLARLRTLCHEMADAVDGKLGNVVAKHEELILEYYRDVRMQAVRSFESARVVAWIGFWILIATVAYALIFDAFTRFEILNSADDMSMTVARVGLLSAVLVEFIAAINFWLYSRSARQFGAFHICLERTHRYLLAYKIAQETGQDGASTVRDIACIMANAPMIGRAEFESATLDQTTARTARLTALSTGVSAT